MKRYFGVELEITDEVDFKKICKTVESQAKIYDRRVSCQKNWNLTTLDQWEVKRDSTCGSTIETLSGAKIQLPGWEVVSFKAKGPEQLDEIAEMAKALSRAKCQVNDKCGFHIHANASDIKPEQIGVILANWIKIEPYLCNAMPAHRVGNKYCKLLSKMRRIALNASHDPLTVWEKFRPTKLMPWNNPHKKVTLNLVNYTKALIVGNRLRKTIEFRMPEGTLDQDAIIGWVLFFINFIDKNKTAKMPMNLKPATNLKEFFDICGLGNTEIKSFEITSNDLGSAKFWLLLRLAVYGNALIRKQIDDGDF